MVRALAKATAQEPFIVAKPNSYAIDLIINLCKLNKNDIIMIGDNLETDILFA